MKMNKFGEWLKIRESLHSSWTNPSTVSQTNYGGRADMSQIKHWLINMKKSNPTFDPVQGMPNIVANSNTYGLPPQIPGAERPLSMKLLAIMQSWGFNKPEEFYNWWQSGGRDAMQQMALQT